MITFALSTLRQKRLRQLSDHKPILPSGSRHASCHWNVPRVRDVSSLFDGAGRKALVTGVAGFIGSHVAKDCLELGLQVVGVDDLSGGFRKNIPSGVRFVLGDLKNATFVSSLLQAEKFDVVYHLAAYAAEGLSHFIRNYNYQNNLIATTNLITQSVRVGSVKRFVFTSSIAVYGSGRTPMTEDLIPIPEDPYGISKLACEYDLQAAHDVFGLEYVIFRPHNVYGPGQNMYDKYRNVVGIFLNQLKAGKDLTVFGNGFQTRKFSYITDVSYPIALSGFIEHVKNEIFNVGGDIATNVNELAQITKEVWGRPNANVIHLDKRNEVAHAESGHQKLSCFFPGLPKPVGLRKGMTEMVRWAKTVGKHFEPIAFDAVEVKKHLPISWNSKNLSEVPAFTHDMNDNEIENSFEPAIPALVVFTMIRADLLELYLKSIDFRTDRLFVIVNHASERGKRELFAVLGEYKGCGTAEERCRNTMIGEMHILTSVNNIGYAGSFNVGIKAMIQHNVQYAIFNGDDTRFRPGRLKIAMDVINRHDACMYHFEGYSSFAITLEGVKRIGSMDENFWPIYSEDCDYWFRAQLAGCKLYYRGGYLPEDSNSASLENAFVDHGDIKDANVKGSSTFKSDSSLAKLVQNTLDPRRGRFAYLVRKWGFDTCSLYHKNINLWRDSDVVLHPVDEAELQNQGLKTRRPYGNDNFTDIRKWDRDDWRRSDGVSPRSINSDSAPDFFVWQDADDAALDVLNV